jgi:predicted MarR family transcription regulator
MQKVSADDRSPSDGHMGNINTQDVAVDTVQTSVATLPKRTAGFGDIELSMVSAMHVFQRWTVCCMEVAGLKDLSVIDVLVLQHVNHPAHCRRLADICFVYNIEDTHVVAYSLRKLIALQVVNGDKHGKEVTYLTTPAGQEYLTRYRAIRDQCLLDGLKVLGPSDTALKELAQFLRNMSGLYDQAARAASSL